jgi:hypothetical protein
MRMPMNYHEALCEELKERLAKAEAEIASLKKSLAEKAVKAVAEKPAKAVPAKK